MVRILIEKILRPRVVACWVSATSIAAFAGPFGTFQTQPVLDRVLYWALVIGISIIIAYTARIVVWRVWPSLSWVASEAVATLIFGATYTPVLWQINVAWFGGAQALMISFPVLLGFVLLVAASVSVFIAAFNGVPVPDDPPPAAAPDALSASLAPPLLSRLPTDLRGEIFAVCANDHYVHVFTDRGRVSLLMRFADAVAELGDLDGLKVHRSHWVARAAVAAQRRSSGRMFLVLKNGVEVPVSRSYRAEVERQFSLPDALASG